MRNLEKGDSGGHTSGKGSYQGNRSGCRPPCRRTAFISGIDDDDDDEEEEEEEVDWPVDSSHLGSAQPKDAAYQALEDGQFDDEVNDELLASELNLARRY